MASPATGTPKGLISSNIPSIGNTPKGMISSNIPSISNTPKGTTPSNIPSVGFTPRASVKRLQTTTNAFAKQFSSMDPAQ